MNLYDICTIGMDHIYVVAVDEAEAQTKYDAWFTTSDYTAAGNADGAVLSITLFAASAAGSPWSTFIP